MRWYGWIWCTRRQLWERVCSGDSLAECSKRLCAAVDARNTKDRYATMTGGGVPGFRPHSKPVAERSPAETARRPTETEESL